MFIRVPATVRTVVACTVVASAFVSQVHAEDKKPKIPKNIMSLFGDKTDTPAKREYLSKAEIHDLLSKHPVFCDGNTESLFECAQVSFDSETKGRIRGQVQLIRGAKATIYQEATFSLSDDGICMKAAETDQSLEISGKNNAEISSILLPFMEYVYALDYYGTLDCIKFSRPETKKTTQGKASLDQYESIQLINGQWKTDKKPKPTTFYETWNMASGSFKVTKLFSRKVPSKAKFNLPISMFGQKAILGAPWANDGRGAAYVYDIKTGKQISELTIENGGGRQPFAVSVAISENTAVVGTQGAKDDPAGAYLFDVTTGQQTGHFAITDDKSVRDDKKEKLVKPTYAPVGISGSTAIVGLPGYIDPKGKLLQPGSTIYLLDAATGKQRAELTPSAGTDMSAFGSTAAISGNRAIVGAPFEGNGTAYLFDTETGKQIAKLVADNSKKDASFFGRSVAMSGNVAIIGAYAENNYQGAAYLFDTTTGKQLGKLTAGKAVGMGFFGFSVAISGNTAVVGAIGMPLNEDATQYARGSAFVFDVATGSQISWITAGNKADGRNFGEHVEVAGDNILVRSGETPKNNEGKKTAYLFQLE